MSTNTKVKDMDTKESRIEKIMEIAHPGGFIDESMIDEIESIDRFAMLIVRCGGGRFICAAQDVKHFINIINNERTDYVRDVSVAPRG